MLQENFGENLSGDKTTHAVVKQVLKRGMIENQESYRVIYEYLLDISPTDPYYEDIEQLETLLENYQK